MKCSRNGKELENVEEYRRSQKGNEAMMSKRRRTNKVNIKQERKKKKKTSLPSQRPEAYKRLLEDSGGPRR